MFYEEIAAQGFVIRRDTVFSDKQRQAKPRKIFEYGLQSARIDLPARRADWTLAR